MTGYIKQGMAGTANNHSLEKAIITVFDSNPNPGLIVDLKTNTIISANKAFIDWSGYGRENIEGKSELNLQLWKHPEQRDAFKSIFNSYGIVENQEVCFINKDGLPSIFLLSAFPIDFSGKSCLLSLAKEHNINKPGRDLFKFDDIAGQFPDIIIGIGLVDKDDSIRSCNSAYAGILNVENSLSLIGLKLAEFVPESQREVFNTQRNICKLRRNHHFETEIISSRNIKKIIAVSTIPQYNNRYEYVAGFELICTTATKCSGEILKYSGNHATVGKFTDQILKDFKNIAALINISDYNYFCQAS
jgi:PAS domain-containing protein